MNTTTKTELAEVSQSNIAALPPAARAAVVLKSEQTRKELTALAAQSAGILTVLNADGREQAHRVGMTLKGARVAIEKTGKAAREDATAFSKAVIAEEKALIALVEPEEARVLKLRDAWDEKIEAEKQAKIAAERARVEAINDKIEAIRGHELLAVRTTFAIADFKERIEQLDALEISAEVYQERAEEAATAKAEALTSMRATLEARIEAEAAARAAEEARKAEAAGIEAERAELARLRAEQAERERLAKIESDRIAAEQAALNAERDRIAAEQAAEAKRLADLAAAQEAEARRAQERAEANMRAEREALAERERLADEAQVKAAADLKAAIEAHALEVAAHAAKLRVDIDHAEALAMNAEFDAAIEAERVRLQALADQAAADARERADDERKAGLPAGSLRAPEVIEGPSDQEIIETVAAAFDMTVAQAVQRLAAIDFAAAREAA